MRRRQLATLTLLFATLLSGCRHAESNPDVFTGLAESANRVLIVDNNTRAARQIQDPEARRQLRRTIGEVLNDHAELPQAEGFTCLCYADFVVAWLDGDARLTAVGLQPDHTLTWPEGPVLGDLTLRPEQISELHASIAASFANATPIPQEQVPALD